MLKHRLECDTLSVQGFSHGFFTRNGGVSTPPYNSLNCGFGSGDDSYNVQKNRNIVATTLGVLGTSIITPHQHHSADVIIANQSWEPDAAPKGDAIVTQTNNLIIGILTADCAPVLFIDPKNKIIAAAHAGWRGALGGIIENTIEAMRSLGAKRRDIIASVGPALGTKKFEVGPEFHQQFIDKDPKFDNFFNRNEKSDKHHFNLSEYIIWKLKSTGIDQASAFSLCTYENESLLFSYRRNTHQSIGDYGRQISAIVIN